MRLFHDHVALDLIKAVDIVFDLDDLGAEVAPLHVGVLDLLELLVEYAIVLVVALNLDVVALLERLDGL